MGQLFAILIIFVVCGAYPLVKLWEIGVQTGDHRYWLGSLAIAVFFLFMGAKAK